MNALFWEGSKSCERTKGRAPELRAPFKKIGSQSGASKSIEPSWFCGRMRTGQTFRISSQEHVHPALRTFMLLWVAGGCPHHTKTPPHARSPQHVAFFYALRALTKTGSNSLHRMSASVGDSAARSTSAGPGRLSCRFSRRHSA